MSLGLVVGLAACGAPAGEEVALEPSSPGLGFDDLRYSPALHRVLVPGGRAGVLALIDPDTLAVTAVAGFRGSPDYPGGHDRGATSVDEGRGMLFVTDRDSGLLAVVDPAARRIVASAPLGASPDYVRYVAATNEVWVSEPSAAQLEIFSLGADNTPSRSAAIHVENGPESLVVDQAHGRAYTHRWQRSSLVFDVRTRALVAEWPNGCAASRGLAIDEASELFFAVCSEGTVNVLDAAHGGRIVSTLARGTGFDVVGYSPELRHLYLAGSACGCLVMMGVSTAGQLSLLGRFDAPGGTHCVTADDRGHAWVCDPGRGSLWRVADPYSRSGP